MSVVSRVTATQAETPYQVVLVDDLGHTWHADEPEDVGGGNSATSPDRLLLSALGGCTAVTVRMFANRRGWPLTGIRVELALNPEGKPAAGTDITRRIALEGELSDEQRTALMKVAESCPIHRILTGEVRIATTAAV